MKYIKLFENFNNTLINENYTLQNFKSDFGDKVWYRPFEKSLGISDDYDINNKEDWNKIMNMNRQELKSKFGCDLTMGEYAQLQINKRKSEVLSDVNTKEGRLEALKKFFKSGATGEESQNIIAIYKHFKNGRSIDDLEPSLQNLYKESPGIFNFSNFTKEQFMEIVKELAKDNSSFRDYIDEDDDTPSFDISSKGTAFNMR